MAGVLEVHTTFASEGDAIAVARALVSERLAACAQVVPGVTSIYRWEGMLRHDEEVLLLLKTTLESWPALRDRLAELHPYDTPEIIALPVEHGGFSYISWVKENTERA
jgi:periplasmic divalent cation tolerance protein